MEALRVRKCRDSQRIPYLSHRGAVLESFHVYGLPDGVEVFAVPIADEHLPYRVGSSRYEWPLVSPDGAVLDRRTVHECRRAEVLVGAGRTVL